MSSEIRLKTLRTKTGVVKRITREKHTYEIEADQQRARIQKYKDEGRDDHDVRKQEEGLLECLKMVPDCQQRLAKAYEELKSLLAEEEDLKDTGEYLTADMILRIAALELPEEKKAAGDTE